MTPSAKLLEKLAYEGLKRIGKLDDKRYRDRLRYELDVIIEHNLEDYFLVVWDFAVHYADNELHTIRGPGRGSGSGSLVVYCLDITKLDPVEEGLPFSRFLNKGRLKKMAMPDLDLDFTSKARDKIIEYLINKYGADRVAGIGNVGKYEAKAAIRAATRALGYDYMIGESLSEIYPPPVHGKGVKLADAYQQVPELKKYRDSDGEEGEILRLAEALEGNIEKIGVHAAGIVISPVPITDIVPLARSNKGIPVTQFPMEEVEQFGLIKYDLLVISNLDIIEDTIKTVKERKGVDIDIYNLPKDDEKVYDLINSGLLAGIFQLEGSPGMKEVVKGIQVKNIDDISACVALFRPGPLDAGLTQEYIEIRQGRKSPSYLHPSLEKVIDDTKGIIIYQEQVMKIATDLAGFTEEEADDVRKALGKKKKKLLESLGEKLKQGLIEKSGFTKEEADQLWKNLVLFSGYSFNRCLPIETELVTASGEIKTIAEMDHATYLLSSNKQPNRVEAVEYVGELEVIEVELDNGATFQATPEHKFMAIVEGEQRMIPLQQIIDEELEIVGAYIRGYRHIGKKPVYNIVLESEPHDFLLSCGVIASNSHSRSYGEIAYWTAWLKTHYPAEFMAAVMTHRSNKLENYPRYIYECKEMGVEVLPPDVNSSDVHFKVADDHTIIWGLGAVKGVGRAARSVVKEREKGGQFRSVFDLKLRLQGSGATKKQVEQLILAGALDSLYSNRGIAIQELEATAKYQEELKKYSNKRATYEKRLKAFGEREAQRETARVLGKKVPPPLKEPKAPEKPEFKFDRNKIDRRRLISRSKALRLEEELLGAYASGHPVNLAYVATEPIDKVLYNARVDDMVRVSGLIESSAFRISKKGNNYMIGALSDMSATIPIVAFARTINDKGTASLLAKGNLVEIEGRVIEKGDGFGLIVERVSALTKKKEHVPIMETSSSEILDEVSMRRMIDELGYRSTKQPFTLTINLISGSKLIIRGGA